MVSKVQSFFTLSVLAKYSAAQMIFMFLAVFRRCTSRKTRIVAPEMFGLTCRVGAHISCYAHDTRFYPNGSFEKSEISKNASEVVGPIVTFSLYLLPLGSQLGYLSISSKCAPAVVWCTYKTLCQRTPTDSYRNAAFMRWLHRGVSCGDLRLLAIWRISPS